MIFVDSYKTDSHTILIVSSIDEDYLSDKNIKEHTQYQHVRVNVRGRGISISIVCHVVISEHSYNIENITMTVDNIPNHNDIVHRTVGSHGVRFHKALQALHNNIILFE